jgi:hypothetical protein
MTLEEEESRNANNDRKGIRTELLNIRLCTSLRFAAAHELCRSSA